MSKYTTQVRFICETAAGMSESAGYSSVNEIIQGAIPSVFNFDFPIFDADYRNVLCTKILKHYYTREIGAETVGLWKLWLDTRLNEIMPYYNKLYESELIDFNPMYDVDLTTQHTREGSGSSDSTGNVTETNSGNSGQIVANENQNTNWNLFSSTPQGALDNVDNESYLTTATKNTDSGDSTTNTDYEYSGNRVNDRTDKTEITNLEEYVQTIKGKSAGSSYAKRLQEFRKTFLNIDAMIIDELSDLFMNLW